MFFNKDKKKSKIKNEVKNNNDPWLKNDVNFFSRPEENENEIKKKKILFNVGDYKNKFHNYVPNDSRELKLENVTKYVEKNTKFKNSMFNKFKEENLNNNLEKENRTKSFNSNDFSENKNESIPKESENFKKEENRIFKNNSYENFNEEEDDENFDYEKNEYKKINKLRKERHGIFSNNFEEKNDEDFFNDENDYEKINPNHKLFESFEEEEIKANSKKLNKKKNSDDYYKKNIFDNLDVEVDEGYQKEGNKKKEFTFQKNESKKENLEKNYKVEIKNGTLKAVLITASVFLVIFLIFYLYNKNENLTEKEIPYIHPERKMKIKITDEKPIPFQDEIIYGKLEKTKKKNFDEIENIYEENDFPPEVEHYIQSDEDDEFHNNRNEEDEANEENEEENLSDEINKQNKAEEKFLKRKKKEHYENQSKVTEEAKKIKIDKEKNINKNPINKILKNIPSNEKFKNNYIKKMKTNGSFFLAIAKLPSKHTAIIELQRLQAKHKILKGVNLKIKNYEDDGIQNYKILAGPFGTQNEAIRISKALNLKYKLVN